jgi:hypothetical protein
LPKGGKWAYLVGVHRKEFELRSLVFALAMFAAPVHADSDLCANATSAESAFRVLHVGLEEIVTQCQGRNSMECHTARQTMEEYENTARGMGIVAVNWTRRQACDD